MTAAILIIFLIAYPATRPTKNPPPIVLANGQIIDGHLPPFPRIYCSSAPLMNVLLGISPRAKVNVLGKKRLLVTLDDEFLDTPK
jgi:hypothetical protein